MRSRAAQAGLNLIIDSAGTSAWHIGEPPDSRSIEHGLARGYNFEGQSARQFDRGDFARFDYILAMDRKNLSAISALKPGTYSGHLGLCLDFASASAVKGQDVPDPYYGGPHGFDQVIDMIERACDGLIAHIQDQAKREPKSG